MAKYFAPLEDMRFLLYEVFDLEAQWGELGLAETVDGDTCDAILEEMNKLAGKVLAPINRSGDEQGCRLEDGAVKVPEGFVDAYRTFAEGGWTALAGNPSYGGMGMPKALAVLCDEMVYSANSAFALYPGLTAGACVALEAHGSESLKSLLLPHFYAGDWSAAMALTEPHAGTDLGLIRTAASDNGDGTFSIAGNKIFITAGEHDLCDNIVHFVLAKLPDAPPGPKGISLFAVPKFWIGEDGSLGDHNGIECASLEHKMGIKASATCAINYNGSRGYLIGEPHRGLACMFTMMNYERLSIGIQGIGSAERSYQAAREYARERLQGRAAKGAEQPDKHADPIIVHPDVRRMLLTMRAWTEASRALAVYTAAQLDTAKHAEGAERVNMANERIALLTPLCKAFFTDKGFDSCVLGQQIFGGHGYIREYGQEQLVRDTRIAQIYEGTNGIQALDLVARKVVGSNGALMQSFIAEMRESVAGGKFGADLEEALALLERVTADLLRRAGDDVDAAGAASVEYLHLFGLVTYAWLWQKMVACADLSSDFGRAKLATAAFFFRHLLPQAEALASSIEAGSEAVMNLSAELF